MNGVRQKNYSNRGNPVVQQEVDLISGGKLKLRILDVGCGAGDNARLLRDKGHTVDGITLSQQEATNAKEYLDRVFIHNLESGLPDELDDSRYDVVICAHVLEHICFPEALLEDIKSVLKEDGLLIVCLPNIMYYQTRMKLIMGDFEYTDNWIMDNTHFRWYTYESAQRLLEDHGFRIKKKKSTITLPFGRMTEKFPSFIREPFRKFLHFVSPGFFGHELFYLSAK